MNLYIIDLMAIAMMLAYATITYEQHRNLSYAFVAAIFLLVVTRMYENYRMWDAKLKAHTALYDAIALINCGDLSGLPKVLSLCSGELLSVDDCKFGMEVLEKTAKNNPEKAMAAFSQSIDKYYGANDEPI